MKISTLTRLGLVLNGAVGIGDYDDVDIQGVKRFIESGSIFDTLKAILVGVEVEPAEQVELLEEWRTFGRMLDEGWELSVTRPRSGLTLLLAYVLYGIQTRIGTLKLPPAQLDEGKMM